MTPAVHEMCLRLQELNRQFEEAPDEGARMLTVLLMQGALQEAKDLATTLESFDRLVRA